jgi:hypothetical protein
MALSRLLPGSIVDFMLAVLPASRRPGWPGWTCHARACRATGAAGSRHVTTAALRRGSRF